MKTAYVTGAILILLASVVALAEERPTPSTHGFADPLAPLFDVKQWALVQATHAAFGNEHPETWVQLLKSIPTPYEDGVGRPMCAVNVLVVENGRMLYSFAPLAVSPNQGLPSDHVGYMDDRGVTAGAPLEVRDVTGDHVPEIIFHSGVAGASDFLTDIHVLHYEGAGKFRDVRADQFFETEWQRFRWIDLDGKVAALVAVSVEPSDDPDLTCHLCPKYHKYLVLRWEQTQGRFVLSQTIPSNGKLHMDGEDWLQGDWSYIMAKLGSGSGTSTKMQ